MLTAPSEWTIEYSMAVEEKRCSCGILSQCGMMIVAVRHAALLLQRARAVVRRVRALELLGQSIAGACAGLEVVPTGSWPRGCDPTAKCAGIAERAGVQPGTARGVEGGRRW